jgi:selenide, water dikinase
MIAGMAAPGAHVVDSLPLTALSQAGGCGRKVTVAELLALLEGLPAQQDERLLVGAASRDDAAVFRVREDLALVQSVDFFTPLVDDPYDFGRIAAANALSDVYAMGGAPLSALNIVAFPLRELGGEILRGGSDVVAGAVVVGGTRFTTASRSTGSPSPVSSIPRG